MNKQAVEPVLGRKGGTVEPKTGSPHMLLWFKSKLSLVDGVASERFLISVFWRLKVPHTNDTFYRVGTE